MRKELRKFRRMESTYEIQLGTASRLKGLGIQLDNQKSKRSLIKDLRDPIQKYKKPKEVNIEQIDHISEEEVNSSKDSLHSSLGEEPDLVSPGNIGTVDTASPTVS
jgi:hypothetical protein